MLLYSPLSKNILSAELIFPAFLCTRPGHFGGEDERRFFLRSLYPSFSGKHAKSWSACRFVDLGGMMNNTLTSLLLAGSLLIPSLTSAESWILWEESDGATRNIERSATHGFESREPVLSPQTN